MTSTPILNDSLDDLLTGGVPTERRELPMDPAFIKIRETVPEFTEKCPACHGTGRFVSWSGRVVGQCFKCKGKGSRTFKSSPEARANAKDARQRREAKFASESLETFKSNHPDAMAWIQSNTAHNGFAASMLQAIQKYGDLTERQLAAVMNNVLKAAARKKERETFAEAVASEKPRLDVTKLQGAFNAAHANGLKRIQMRVDGFTFSRAPDTGRNPGAIYVKHDGIYLGKIVDGVFHGRTTPELEAKLIVIATDPLAAAKAYGIRTGTCSCCGRELTDPVSIAAGIGPICADRFGF